MVLLNARGEIYNHNLILEYAQSKGIHVIEFTANKERQSALSGYGSSKLKVESSKAKPNTQIQTVISKPRRQRIIELIKQNYNDEQILKILDSDYSSVFVTTNKQALYGTKRDKRIYW